MAGIYIHIPFCRQACTYCNFHFSTSLKSKDRLLAALNEEILLPGDFIAASETINTIYFGGGTPSILAAADIRLMLQYIRAKYTIAADAEITLEANPDDINPAILQQWLDMGINRLSLGVQSFSAKELSWMNRAHTADESLQSIDDIIAAGFKNFSVDLIYGSPLLTNEALERNAAIIFDKGIPHISCYALTVEPKTALDKMISTQTSPPVDTDRQAEQFDLLLKLTEAAGYEQYEISNFAKPGFRSRHNTSYWQGVPYHGFGPAAHSYNGIDKRRWNIANNALYIESLEKKIIPFEEEVLTPDQLLNEYIMTALRTSDGIDLETVEQRFGNGRAQTIITAAEKFITRGHMLYTNGRLVLTNKGKFLADGIAADLFF